jgi:hypothetical protein
MSGIIFKSAILLILVSTLNAAGALDADSALLVRTKGNAGQGGRMASFPGMVLWAWEKPERLGFIDVNRVGVAFLSRTCLLKGDGVTVRPRMQPLHTPSGTALMAVVRIESSRRSPPRFGPGQMDALVQAIVKAAQMPGLHGVQIDFDAGASQRPFYRELLERVRGALPDSMALSITALASWCMFDGWMSDLPVDEIVPMVFRMGADADRVRSHLAGGGGFACRSCGGSVGVCTDEPWPTLPGRMRVYVFHPGAWSREAYERVEAALGKLERALE